MGLNRWLARAGDKGKRQGKERSLSHDAVMAGFELTEPERKLLRLALCESAQPGEVSQR